MSGVGRLEVLVLLVLSFGVVELEGIITIMTKIKAAKLTRPGLKLNFDMTEDINSTCRTSPHSCPQGPFEPPYIARNGWPFSSF